MKEIQDILKKISQVASNEKAILVTVVEVIGSGCRRAGARMLIDADGNGIGTISGGCLESDVLERAKKVLETGAREIETIEGNCKAFNKSRPIPPPPTFLQDFSAKRVLT